MNIKQYYLPFKSRQHGDFNQARIFSFQISKI